MENLTKSLSEIQVSLASINAYLAAFAEEVENKKKKVDKEKNTHKKKEISCIQRKQQHNRDREDCEPQLAQKEPKRVHRKTS